MRDIPFQLTSQSKRKRLDCEDWGLVGLYYARQITHSLNSGNPTPAQLTTLHDRRI
jgi:hypothetical protein